MDAVRYIDEHFEKLKLLHEGKVTVIWLVLDRQDKVVYAEQVPEIAQEPNYEVALFAVRKIP